MNEEENGIKICNLGMHLIFFYSRFLVQNLDGKIKYRITSDCYFIFNIQYRIITSMALQKDQTDKID